MATNEAANNEAVQRAADEASTDNLSGVSPPTSPQTPETPEYRADVAEGKWMTPTSLWKVGDSVFLHLREGRTAGPFSVTYCHAPRERGQKWRYDVKDAYGNTKVNISGSIMC